MEQKQLLREVKLLEDSGAIEMEKQQLNTEHTLLYWI